MVKKYEEIFIEKIVDLGKEGKTITQMAASLGVSKDLLRRWSKDVTKPEFQEAYAYALTCFQAYHEDVGIKGYKGILKGFVPSTWTHFMKANCRKDYSDLDSTRIELSSPIKNLSDKELDETIAALEARRQLNKTKPDGEGSPSQVQ